MQLEQHLHIWIKKKKKEKSSFLPYIIEYKEKLVFKLEENCKKFIEFTDLYLLSKENDDKSKVFYYKINGDAVLIAFKFFFYFIFHCNI